MIERCYVMVKPGFVNDNIVNETINTLKSLNMVLEEAAKIKYDYDTARLHYIEKQAKPYVNELIDYLTSDYSYGMVFKGENALNVCRRAVEELRNKFKLEYDSDVMRNFLHCSSKTKVNDTYLELDTQRELAIFHYLKNKK